MERYFIHTNEVIDFILNTLLIVNRGEIFVPKMKKIAMVQADARSLMTGRIVDSYTNIITLKLFSHNTRESEYVRDGMSEFLDTVHPQMRLVTKLNISLWSLNMSLVFSTAALGIYLWINGAITPGAIAIVMSLAIRLTGMSHWILWEISSLFENIGTVQDGINTLSVPNVVVDKANAKPLCVVKGEIDFSAVNFFGAKLLPLWEPSQKGWFAESPQVQYQ